MKKKETIWEMLKRLDEEAGQFNIHISEANRYFDLASDKTKKMMKEHEKDLQRTIRQFRVALRSILKEKKEKEK
jgi:hypothetical protein